MRKFCIKDKDYIKEKNKLEEQITKKLKQFYNKTWAGKKITFLPLLTPSVALALIVYELYHASINMIKNTLSGKVKLGFKIMKDIHTIGKAEFEKFFLGKVILDPKNPKRQSFLRIDEDTAQI